MSWVPDDYHYHHHHHYQHYYGYHTEAGGSAAGTHPDRADPLSIL
jgi:hypothetical protein